MFTNTKTGRQDRRKAACCGSPRQGHWQGSGPPFATGHHSDPVGPDNALTATVLLPARRHNIYPVPEDHTPVLPEYSAVQQSRAVPHSDKPMLPCHAARVAHLPGVRLRRVLTCLLSTPGFWNPWKEFKIWPGA